jgi:hypothetical protein
LTVPPFHAVNNNAQLFLANSSFTDHQPTTHIPHDSST